MVMRTGAAAVVIVAVALAIAGAAARPAAAALPLSAGCEALNAPFLDGTYSGVFPFSLPFHPGERLTLINDAAGESEFRGGVADGFPRREFRWTTSFIYEFAAEASYHLEWVTEFSSNWQVDCRESTTAQHFQGYDVDGEEPDFHGETARLTDQFGSETVYVGDARMWLTPVASTRAGHPSDLTLRPDNHLKCYRVTGGARLDRLVRPANRFTTTSELLVKEPNRFCTAAARSDGVVIDRPRDFQDYKCYRVEERPALHEEVVELRDQFGDRHAVVRRAEQLCTPAELERETEGSTGAPPRPSEDLVCYGIRELDVFDPRRIFTVDQFGFQSIRVFDPLVLCVPSNT